MPFRFALSALTTSVKVGQQADADVGTKVNLAGQGSNSGVDPVLVEGSVFFD